MRRLVGAMRSLSPARCLGLGDGVLQGVEASMEGGCSYKACHRRTMSPCPVEYSCIPGCSDISSVVPVAEASFNLSGPAGQWLAGTRPKVHVAGVPLSSIRIGCRLGSVVPSGLTWCRCGRCSSMRWKGTSCASPVGLGWRANESLALYGTSSPAWKRGSPLSPGVVVGEGASKLTWFPAGVSAMGKVSKALWLIHLMMNQIDRSSGCDTGCMSSPELAWGAGLLQGVSVVLLTSGKPAVAGLKSAMVADNT